VKEGGAKGKNQHLGKHPWSGPAKKRWKNVLALAGEVGDNQRPSGVQRQACTGGRKKVVGSRRKSPSKNPGSKKPKNRVEKERDGVKRNAQ